jgi:hypothetical protein
MSSWPIQHEIEQETESIHQEKIKLKYKALISSRELHLIAEKVY